MTDHKELNRHHLSIDVFLKKKIGNYHHKEGCGHKKKTTHAHTVPEDAKNCKSNEMPMYCSITMTQLSELLSPIL